MVGLSYCISEALIQVLLSLHPVNYPMNFPSVQLEFANESRLI